MRPGWELSQSLLLRAHKMDGSDSEVSLPRATVVKLIKDYMPGEMRVAADTTDLLVQCCTEFVQLVGSEANTAAEKEGKKTIQPEHVLSALTELGFSDYCQEVSAAWDAFKEEAKASNEQKAALRKTGAAQAGLSQEEQIALQQQMFAAARAASLTTAESAAAMAAAYQAQLQLQQQYQQQQEQQQQAVEGAQGGTGAAPGAPPPPPQQLAAPGGVPPPQVGPPSAGGGADG